jgi:hypothetical protein
LHLVLCTKPYMGTRIISSMSSDEKVALEISIVKKRRYITSTHSINVDHLTEAEVDEFSKILYDKAVMLLINYYPQGQIKKEEPE